MEGFKTARALILDDKPNEALAIIQALGILGIGAVYHDGSASTLYAKKLTGIRILFVDMVLAEHGADATDPTKCVRMVVETLNALVEDSTDPLVVVCWTGHEDMKDEFSAALRTVFTKSRIGEVILADKTSLMRAEEREKLKALIINALGSHTPADLLFRWEQRVHDAATSTTSAITSLINDFSADSANWSDCAHAICAALALAERGTRLSAESPEHAMKGLFDALNPILADRLDHNPVNLTAEIQPVAQALFAKAKAEQKQWEDGRKADESKRKRADGIQFVRENFAQEVPESKVNSLPPPSEATVSLLSSKLRAALNKMLHISSNVAASEVCPGNIFFVERGSDNRKTFETKFGKDFPNWQEIREDSLFPCTGSLPENHFPIIVEFSATCDFAQAKMKLPRFVGGFVIPETAFDTIRSTAYLRKIGPLLLSHPEKPKLDGVYSIVLNAHYLLGLDQMFARGLKALFRLRTPILTDFTMWVSNHQSRPGTLHIGP